MVAPIASMRRVAEAFEKADLQPLFDIIAENIVWKSGSTIKGPFLFGGKYVGRPDVLELTVEISAGYVFRQFVPKEIICHNDIVWGLFQVEGNYMPPRGQTRKPFQFECAIRWRVQGEKVVEHQTFFDTNALLRERCCRGTFRSDVERVIVGAAGGSDTCRFRA
jgi:ketosteroid isomerase-like protein